MWSRYVPGVVIVCAPVSPAGANVIVTDESLKLGVALATLKELPADVSVIPDVSKLNMSIPFLLSGNTMLTEASSSISPGSGVRRKADIVVVADASITYSRCMAELDTEGSFTDVNTPAGMSSVYVPFSFITVGVSSPLRAKSRYTSLYDTRLSATV